MSQFAITGLSSGLDTKTIISQLMSIDSQPKTKMQWNQQLVAARKTAWTDLNAKVETLRLAANALTQAQTWNPAGATSTATTFGATSTDPTRISSAVTGTPTPGTYAVQVSQLAQGEVSKTTVTNGTVAANDTLTITQGGSTWNVALAAGDTFGDVVTKINAATGNNGVSAGIENGAIKLISTGVTTGTGSAAAFSITSAGSTATDFGFNETQSAQNAIFYVDGALHQSGANYGITGAITGVTLNLSGTTAGSITVAQTDASGKTPKQIWEDSVVTKVKAFTDAFNAVQTQVYQKTQAESKVTSPANKTTGITLSEYLAGPMARNTSYASVATQMREQVSGSVSGVDPATSMLASIGISTGKYTAGGANGLLSVDETKLRAAIQADPAKVQALFGQAGATSGISADDGIARRVSEMASIMQAAPNGGSSAGVIGAALDTATVDSKRLQESIDRATDRLERRQSYYERMYAALEVSLGKMQSQSAWMSSQLAGITANNG